MEAASELEGRLLAQRYLLESEIASGGMGMLWLARDEVLGRQVAVKVLHDHLANDDGLLERFRMEAVAAARLSHPAVVRVFDTGIDDGVCYIVMELVDGRTAADLLRERGALPPEEAVVIVRGVLHALAHAHREGVVHRDVKPANMLIARDGLVKLADFGIAKAAFARGDLTTTGDLLGTSRYLSPEQVTGGEVDARSDLYSTGVVLYELLAGRPPFEGGTHIATATMRLTADPPPPRSLRPGIPRQLEAVVLKAIARDPAGRYQTAEEMSAALERAAPGTAARPRPQPVPDEVPVRRSIRSWVLIPVTLLAVAALVVGVFLLLEGFGDDRETRRESRPRSVVSLEVVGAFSHDPLGGDGEYDEDTPLAIDGNEDTFWTTEGYEQDFGIPGKEGVGLMLELAEETPVGEVRILTDTAGWAFSLYAVDDPEDFDVEGASPLASDVAELEGSYSIEQPVETRYLLVWITGLVPIDAYRAHINEIEVLAPGD